MQKLAIALALTFSLPALAQEPPKMSPEGRKLLDGTVGNWTMKDFVFKMGDQVMKGRFLMNCDKAINGWATLCKGKADLGQFKFDGLYTFAWDIATGQGHMLEVEDSPTVHDHAGKWSDDKTIVLVRNGKNVEGKDETDTVAMTWVSPKEILFAATGKSGSTTNWTCNGTMKK